MQLSLRCKMYYFIFLIINLLKDQNWWQDVKKVKYCYTLNRQLLCGCDISDPWCKKHTAAFSKAIRNGGNTINFQYNLKICFSCKVKNADKWKNIFYTGFKIEVKESRVTWSYCIRVGFNTHEYISRQKKKAVYRPNYFVCTKTTFLSGDQVTRRLLVKGLSPQYLKDLQKEKRKEQNIFKTGF